MAYKGSEFNHTPQWYEERDKVSPAALDMLKRDMAFIDAEYDKKMSFEERVGVYEEAWNAILNGTSNTADVGALEAVMRKDGLFGRPQDEYVKGPFLSIARIMEENGLAAEDVRKFLTWRSKNENMAKARAGIKKKETKKEKAARERKAKLDLLFGKNKSASTKSDF